MDTGTVSSAVSEMGDVGKNEREALKYSAGTPEHQSPYGRQLLKGEKVEQEHKGTINWLKKTPDAPLKAATRSIASEHLEEDPMYYDHLHEMESKYKHAMVAGLFDELEKISSELLASLKSLHPASIGMKGARVIPHLDAAAQAAKKGVVRRFTTSPSAPDILSSVGR